MVHVMSEVKRYVCHGCIWLPRDAYCPVCDPEKGWGKELDAQRLRADTAEAELEVLRKQHAEQSCIFCNNSGELLSKVKAAEQRIAGLKGLLLDLTLDDDFPEHWNEAYAIDATLNPNPEAESHGRISD